MRPEPAGGPSVLLVSTYSRALSNFVAPFAHFLKTGGYRVVLAASDEVLAGPSTIGDLRAQGFETHVVPFTNRLLPTRDFAAAVAMYRLLRRHRFDVVHTHTAKAGVIGRFIARAAKVPLVVHTAFSWPQIDTPSRAWMYGPVERAAGRACDHVFCISELGVEQAHTLGVRPRYGVSCPGIGLDLAQSEQLVERETAREMVGLPEGVPLVGTAARLVPHKRVDHFLAAARLVADRVPHAHFVILGDGPERDVLARLVGQLGLTDRVQFVPYLGSPALVAQYLRSLDVFMLPTEREGFGMVFAEAMVQSTPVVGPDIAPVRDIVGEGGLLVPAGKIGGYAAMTCRLLLNVEERRTMGNAGRRRVRSLFDQKRSFVEMEHIYRRLLGRLADAPPNPSR